MSRLLFEDIFEVLAVDPDGKKFDKGDRDLLEVGFIHWCGLGAGVGIVLGVK